ncbi:MAG: hypothetical protein JXB62_00470 [Pirellulales bacterium]|nr:hypothetical protein [Pirellulales bacterium]
MNDQSRLQRRLEQATAEALPADAPLDAETASLREGWLALGQLLKAVEPALEKPLVLSPATREARPGRLAIRWAAALAASLLIVASLAFGLLRPKQGGAIAEKPAEPAAGAVQTTAPSPTPMAPEKGQLAWDDPLDEELALAGQHVIRLQQDWCALEDPFDPVYDGLEEVGQDIEGNTL